MKRNKFVIIGLGDIGQELLKKLSKDFDIVCIDLNPELEEIAKKI
ncbi:MAG: NAD-binding protein [Thermodesulfovibrionia bacterium]|nr:NAD-binding protein [Thermodesulfovibrionia bacterium]